MCQSKCFTKLENGINYLKFEGEITKIRKKRNIKVMFLKLKRFKIPKKGLIKKNVSQITEIKFPKKGKKKILFK